MKLGYAPSQADHDELHLAEIAQTLSAPPA